MYGARYKPRLLCPFHCPFQNFKLAQIPHRHVTGHNGLHPSTCHKIEINLYYELYKIRSDIILEIIFFQN